MKIIKLFSYIITVLLFASFVSCGIYNPSTPVISDTDCKDPIETNYYIGPPDFYFFTHADFLTYATTGSHNESDYVAPTDYLFMYPPLSEFEQSYIPITDLIYKTNEELNNAKIDVRIRTNGYSYTVYDEPCFSVEIVYNTDNSYTPYIPDGYTVSHDISDKNKDNDYIIVRNVTGANILLYSSHGEAYQTEVAYKNYYVTYTAYDHQTGYPTAISPFFSENDEEFSQAIREIINAIDEKVAENAEKGSIS